METEGLLLLSQQPATCHYPSQIDPIHSPISYFLKTHLNIILLSMFGSSKWSLHLRFPHQNPVYTSPLFHTCYLPRQFHSFWVDHPNNIWWGVQIMKPFIMGFSTLACYLVPHRPKYSLQHPVLKHPQPMFHPQCEQSSFTPIQNSRHNYNSVYLNLHIFLGNKLEDKNSAQNDSRHSLISICSEFLHK